MRNGASSALAHLVRDFTAHSEGLGAQKQFGAAGLEIAAGLFAAWGEFRGDADRAELLLGAEPLAVGGEVAHEVRESRTGVAAGRGSRKAHQRSAQATPENSSPSSAWASRR